MYLLLVLVGEGEQGGDVEHELVLLVGGVHAEDMPLKIFICSCNIIYVTIHLCRPVMSALVSRPPRNLGQSRSSTLSPSRHRNCSNPSLPGKRRDKYTSAVWCSLETKQFEFEWTSKVEWGNRETLCEWVSKFYLLLLLTLFHFTIFIINLATMNVFQHDIFIS